MAPIVAKVLGRLETWVHVPGYCTEAQFEAARKIAEADGFESFVSSPFLPRTGADVHDGPILLMYCTTEDARFVQILPDGTVRPPPPGPLKLEITTSFVGTEGECGAFAERFLDDLNRKVGKPGAFKLDGYRRMDEVSA